MSIDHNDPRITAFVLGELTDAERLEVEEQIASSPELRRAVDETRRAVKLLEEHLASEPCPRLSERQRVELMRQAREASMDERAAAATSAVRAPTARRSRRLMAWSALAACVLIGCAVTWTTWHARSKAQLASTELAQRKGELSTDGLDASDEWGLATRPASDGKVRYATDYSRVKRQPVAGPRAVDSVAFSADGRMLARERRPTATQARLSAEPAPVDGLAFPDARTWDDVSNRLQQRQSGEVTQLSSVKLNALGVKVVKDMEESRQGLLVSPQEIVAAAATHEGLLESEREMIPTAAGRPDDGIGPGWSGDKYDTVTDNPFREVKNAALSTFSVDVDTASYSKTRMYLLEHRTAPPPGAVRIEELVNFFRYDYEGPDDDRPFAARMEVATCPWQPKHRLVRIGIKGREIERESRPSSNLVFLLDVSGSMDRPNKLPLVKRGMKRLVDELGENDRVAIAVYAGAAGLVLPSTTGDRKPLILDALDQLHAGGSTNGGQGIRLAYQLALDNFISGGTNRVILCTDGDFNVGTTSTAELVDLVSQRAKDGVFLSVLGFGMGNHNDAMLENVSNRGNGNYAFVDTDAEARKVLVEQMSGTLVTIAKDVKIQVEFNPLQVFAYRLIGYENRILAAEDFNDDKKDAGEIGAGHTVTALYEIIPAGAESDVAVRSVGDLKYQRKQQLTEAASSGELLTLNIRYKAPDADTSQLLNFSLTDPSHSFSAASDDFRFAAAVASFGMLLRDSPHRGDTSYDAVLEIASAALAGDEGGYRQEFLELVRRSGELSPQ